MNVTVLLSCMDQKDKSIIRSTNIQTDAVIVNQCDCDSVEDFSFNNKSGKICHVIFINTTERGLSRSRNMAIRYATKADVCLICDDDEYLYDDYETKLLNLYSKSRFDIITFSIDRKDKRYISDEHVLNMFYICKTSSIEISFRRSAIIDNNIKFDIFMGSGSGNGAGEEIKFLLDCKKNKIKMKYYPIYIGKLLSYNSKWFHGWTLKYFENIGWSSRRIFGVWLGYLYVVYHIVKCYPRYKNDITLFNAFLCVSRGFLEKRS